MTRSTVAPTFLTIAFLAAAAAVAQAQPVFNRAGDISGRDFTVRSLNSAATVGGTSLGTVVAQAAAALPVAGLAAATPLPSLALKSRSLAARFSDSLNVRDYGAKCDGATDDTAAFQAAIAVATGQVPAGGTSAQFGGIVGVGVNKNGSVKVVVPSGACILSSTLTVNMLANSGFSLMGEGTSHTELVWQNSGDGLDINFAASAAGNDIVHNGSYPGQALLIKGIKFVTAYNGASNPGVALNIKGVAIVLANTAPQQVLEDLAFTNRGGWLANTQGWAVGLRYNDPDYVFINRVEGVDLRQAKMIGFQITSDTVIGNVGHGTIVCQDCGQMGGADFFDITGNVIQGVFLERPYWVTVNNGITWLSSVGAVNGSLSIHAASGASGLADLHVSNIGTIFSSGGFYYNNYSASANAGNDWHAVWLDGVDWVNETGDTLTAPPAATLASGHYAYGLVLNQGANGANVYDSLPSAVTGVTIAGTDYGFSAQGPNVVISNGICRGATTCFQDTYTGSDTRFHPQFLHMTTTDELLYAEAGKSNVVVHGSYNQLFSAGVEIGMPGMAIPAVGNGGSGFIDMHSAPSSNGTLAALNDYDCRQLAAGGTSGVVGMGTLYYYCKGGLVTNGAVVDSSPVPIGVSNAATITATDYTAGQILVCSSTSTTIASLTEVLPANPKAKQTFHIAAECAITALTVTGAASSAGVTPTVLGAPAGITPATPVTFVYDNDRALWTRW